MKRHVAFVVQVVVHRSVDPGAGGGAGTSCGGATGTTGNTGATVLLMLLMLLVLLGRLQTRMQFNSLACILGSQ